MTYEQAKALDDAYVMHTFARKPVEFVSGQGMHLQDDAGNDYLDFLSGIGVCCLGHSHPAVVQAVQDQAAKLMHVSNYYYIEQRGEVAEQLSAMLNWGDPARPTPWKTFFANSGAEANECAIKLARLYSRERGHGGQGIVCMERSFHGRTLATLAATQQPVKQAAFQPLPQNFLAAPPNDIEALQAVFDANPQGIAAVMVEPVQGECGVYPLTEEYLQAALAIAHENGALLICDEVQCGIYRTGTPFAFQQLGVVPDIVAMAKGIAGGFPMGACAARSAVAEVFEPGIHGSTFGGSNLAVAAAHATLATLVDEGVPANVVEVGAYLSEKLAELPHVVEVRGMGLMLAVEFDEAVDAPALVLAALGEGLVLNYTGPHTLRFLPPLICTNADVDALMDKLPALVEGAVQA
ncbi:MAG: acetylornithine/succinylornithine family transaminase [Coriobacteriaceae bacterium]|nr:acetylornithine/succinylornithine family transaminase [Coriobacteriaceae bacterium]